MEKVNINTATAEELTAILHIGAKRAAKIIAGRPFRDLYELSKVLGIGETKLFELIKQDIAEV